MLENLTSAAKLSNKEAHTPGHPPASETYTDTHVTEYNGLVKTVLLPRFSAQQNSALAYIDKMFSGNDLQQVA